MSRSGNPPTKNDWAEDFPAGRSVFILEKQLKDTLELQWHVQQAGIRLGEVDNSKIQSLFDGLTGELRTFVEVIRERLQSLSNEDPHLVEMTSSPFWRLFSEDDINCFCQLEALLCGYAHYGRQTSQAMATLEQLGDLESLKLLTRIFTATDRCLWFVEIYMESLALNVDTSSLPQWEISNAAAN